MDKTTQEPKRTTTDELALDRIARIVRDFRAKWCPAKLSPSSPEGEFLADLERELLAAGRTSRARKASA